MFTCFSHVCKCIIALEFWIIFKLTVWTNIGDSQQLCACCFSFFFGPVSASLTLSVSMFLSLSVSMFVLFLRLLVYWEVFGLWIWKVANGHCHSIRAKSTTWGKWTKIFCSLLVSRLKVTRVCVDCRNLAEKLTI